MWPKHADGENKFVGEMTPAEREQVIGDARRRQEERMLLPVECGACGWTGKRKPGRLVDCPKCGSVAAFQPAPKGA